MAPLLLPKRLVSCGIYHLLMGNLRGDMDMLILLKRHIDSEKFDEQNNKIG
jgi:hypothetical protein